MSGFVAILICLVLSAFFSGMEIAFMASNKLRIEIDKSNKGHHAEVDRSFCFQFGNVYYHDSGRE